MSNGKANRLYHDLTYRLTQMTKFGQSKHASKAVEKAKYLGEHGDLKGYNPCKVADSIFSINTLKDYRQTIREFSYYAAANGCKSVKYITRDLAGQYLQERDSRGLSAWTVSKDMSALNKLFNYGFTKKELGLRSRHLHDITRSRGVKTHDARNHERDKDAMTFAQGCGCRRASVTTVTPQDLVRNAQGTVVAVHLTEKGGKHRCAPVLNAYKQAVTEAVNKHITTPDKPIYTHYDVTIDNHAFRADYARALLTQLEQEKAEGLPYCAGDFDPRPLCNLRGKDDSDDPMYREHDRQCCGMTSGALGHNRLEIIFSHYRCGI